MSSVMKPGPFVGDPGYRMGGDDAAKLRDAEREQAAKNTKPSNPKDRVGILKVAFSVIPIPVLWELALAFLEGALKYGRHNYRVIGVRASVYYDAVMARHMPCWWEGEDIDPESGVHHITKAIASLTVLRDAMIRGNWVDDRPPRSDPKLIQEMNAKVKELLAKYPDPVEPYTQIGETAKATTK